ncbi:glycosyltransferase domain-containing protein [Rhizobium sp. Pop5]|uniref:glycosyltransferase domain-containing protein n=1 Tax=Rhizobium sp. Pop5 TaxID=1223565 RepID=UPI000283730A|nr:family 2 glycosyl transferase [Rhizobium sp. Pop5]
MGSDTPEYSNVVVYTALLGPYDSLKLSLAGPVSHLCFTDQVLPRRPPWRILPVKPSTTLDQRVRLARHIKLHPHLYLPEHEYSIWIDACLQPSGLLLDAIGYLGEHDLATFAYPSTYGPRNCAYEEAAACIARRKDDPSKILMQIKRYREEGFPENYGLVETSILVRRNTVRARDFCAGWWSELEHGSRRDQLSFNYVAWRKDMLYGTLPGHRTNSAFATWAAHMQDIYT